MMVPKWGIPGSRIWSKSSMLWHNMAQHSSDKPPLLSYFGVGCNQEEVCSLPFQQPSSTSVFGAMILGLNELLHHQCLIKLHYPRNPHWDRKSVCSVYLTLEIWTLSLCELHFIPDLGKIFDIFATKSVKNWCSDSSIGSQALYLFPSTLCNLSTRQLILPLSFQAHSTLWQSQLRFSLAAWVRFKV